MEEIFNKLKENKAPGDDGIPRGVLKALDSTLNEILAILFNNVMRSGEYPSCWSTGIIIAEYINQAQKMTQTTTEG